MMEQLNEKEALNFFDNNMWKEMSFIERARFQIYQDRLCMPFGIFHEAVEKSLARPVFDIELALNRDGIKKDLGEKEGE